MSLEDVGVNLIAKGEAAFLSAISKSKNALFSFGTVAGSTHGPTEGLTAKSAALANMMGQFLYNAAVKAGQAVLKFGSDSINAASDLNETANKIATIFGPEGTAAVNKFAQGAATSLGQSTQAALDGAATFGVFGKSAGKTGTDLADFSTRLVGLSSDLASFYNTSPEDAILSIGAALRGESEPIRKYGVLLDDATLRQEAMAMGIIKTTKNALTPQQRVLAATSVIFKQTADAQGDFAKTSTGFANSQRVIKAQLDNLKASLGKGVLPLIELGAKLISTQLMPAFSKWAEGAVGSIGPVAERLSWFGDRVLKLFDFIKTGSTKVDLGGWIQTMFGEDMGGSKQIADIVQKVTELGIGISNAFAGIGGGAGGLAGVFAYLGQFSPIFTTISNAILVLTPAFNNLWNSIIASVPMVMATLQNMFNFVVTQITTYGPAIVAQVAGILNQLATFWTNNGATIMAVVATAWQVIVTVITAAMILVSTIINMTLSVINGDWTAAWGSFKSGFEAFMNTVLALAGTNLAAFLTVWNTNLQMAKTILETVFNNAISFLNGLVGQFFSIGANLINGLKQGMQSKVGEFLAWLTGTWKQVQDLANKIFGVASPSTVFAEIGKNLMLGMEMGIDKNSGGVLELVKKLGKDTTGLATNIFTNGALQTANSAVSAMAAVRAASMVTNNTNYYNNTYSLGVTTNQSSSVVTRSFSMMKMLGR